jgi:hypothetical protein
MAVLFVAPLLLKVMGVKFPLLMVVRQTIPFEDSKFFLKGSKNGKTQGFEALGQHLLNSGAAYQAIKQYARLIFPLTVVVL